MHGCLLWCMSSSILFSSSEQWPRLAECGWHEETWWWVSRWWRRRRWRPDWVWAIHIRDHTRQHNSWYPCHEWWSAQLCIPPTSGKNLVQLAIQNVLCTYNPGQNVWDTFYAEILQYSLSLPTTLCNWMTVQQDLSLLTTLHGGGGVLDRIVVKYLLFYAICNRWGS